MTMHVCWLALAALAFTTGCAPAVAQADPAAERVDEEAAVLAATDRYLRAISNKDLQALAELQTPEGVTYQVRPAEGGGWKATPRTNAYWVDPSHYDAAILRERYWSPTVLVRGGMAVVWAPYEFWQDGKTSHCGVDVFNFVKVEGEWRVSSSMWTIEPDACDELRPADPAAIRPAG